MHWWLWVLLALLVIVVLGVSALVFLAHYMSDK